MSTTITWPEIALRLLLTILAAALIGWNRSEHGRPAGLRTTILVAVAACLSMIQVNLLLGVAGKASNSFVVLDLMRLPLGILSGMGFIGAGTIIRRGDMVVGVTTAATMWFITVLGLCFGGGQITLGLVGSGIGVLVLELLKRAEGRMQREHQGELSIVMDSTGPSDDELRAILEKDCFRVASLGFMSGKGAMDRQVDCDLRWKAAADQNRTPESVKSLAARPGIIHVTWKPLAR